MRYRDNKPLRRALALAALLPAFSGAALAQTSFEDMMRMGRKPPPEDFTSPGRDSLDRAFPRGRPRVASAWLDFETRSFTELLKAEKYDLMVAPIRSEGYAVDRISRSLVLASVNRELAARGARVPNPVALSRAFGENRRRFEVGEATAFAKSIGVHKVVIIGVAHDRMGHLRAWIVAVDSGRVETAPDPKPLAELTLGAGEHPSASSKAIIAGVLNVVALSRKPAVRAQEGARQRAVFASPAEAMAVKSGDIEGRAVAFQLIASLAPERPERNRERLFEQALIAAQDLPRTDAHSALFAARAWYHLEARETALAALEGATGPEALAYREFLNGNLPDLAKAVDEVKDELPRLLLEIDLKTLQAAYRHPDAKQSTSFLDGFLAKYPQWAPLVKRRLGDLDPWNTGDGVLAKRMLDRDLGLPGEKLEEQVTGMQLVGRNVDTAALTKLALRHVERARREHRAARGCFAFADLCVAGAYLDLLEAVATSDAIRKIRALVKLQGLPQQARELADALKPELEGHPAVVAVEAEAQLALANKMPGSQRDAGYRELVQLAQAAAFLEQGQSKTSRDALAVLGVPSQYSGPYLSAYRFDLPVRHYWFAGAQYADPVDPKISDDLHRRQLAASAMDLSDAGFFMRDEAGKAELRVALEGRFKGNPDRASLLQTLASSPDERQRIAEAQTKERPDRWSNYAEQASRVIDEKGDYQAAAAAYGLYPGFANPSKQEPVALSNYAYEAGNTFFWQGRLEETRKFYEIAANLETGSAASIASKQRLAQIDRDYGTMLDAARYRGKRYNDPYAWRDFISWLMVLGRPDQAWAAFTQLHSGFDNPQVWLAADVGLRMKGGTWESNKHWLLTEPYKSSRSQGTAHGLRLALMLSAIDRAPAPDLVKTLRELAGPPNTTVEAYMVTRPSGSGTLLIGYPRSRFRAKSRPPVRDGTLADSEFVYFADAYVELRKGNFRAAVERFDRMAEYYAVEGSVLHRFPGFALPYFAWASAKSGDPLGLEAFVHDLNDGRGGDFDRSLALAFFAGLRGEHKAAREHLALAFHHRPFTENRPIFTEYQWAEACEWLYIATREKEYLRLALDWAHRYQQVMPVSAWAYAFEARYATDEQQRLRATAIALYLDPKSERLASVPATFRKRAEQWFATNNPFKAPEGRKDDEARADRARRNTLLQSAGSAS